MEHNKNMRLRRCFQFCAVYEHCCLKYTPFDDCLIDFFFIIDQLFKTPGGGVELQVLKVHLHPITTHVYVQKSNSPPFPFIFNGKCRRITHAPYTRPLPSMHVFAL